MTYQQLMGRRVLTTDGHSPGRVSDLVAEGRGQELRVVALAVGQAGLLRRIGLARSSILPAGRRIATRWVASFEPEVRLKLSWDELLALPGET